MRTKAWIVTTSAAVFAGIVLAAESSTSSNDIQRTSDEHVRVWTKALDRRNVEHAVDALDNAHIQKIANKMAAGYVPPLSVGKALTAGQIVWLVSSEEIANDASLEPVMRTRYELDCLQQRIRALSMEATMNGKHHSSNDVSEWRPIPADGSGPLLSKLACAAH